MSKLKEWWIDFRCWASDGAIPLVTHPVLIGFIPRMP